MSATAVAPPARRPAGRPRAGGGQVGHSQVTVTAIVAAAVVFVTAYGVPLRMGATLGTVVALGLVPVWISDAWRSRAFRWIACLTVASLVSGFLLTELATADHGASRKALLAQGWLLVGIVVAAGWIIWSRRFIPGWGIGLIFGLGLLASVRPGAGMFVLNPWRFGFSVPVTVIALSIAWRLGRRWVDVVVSLSLGVVSALNDGRSTFAILALTAVIVLWQGRRRETSRKRNAMHVALLLAGLAYVAYAGGQALILDGALGEATQARTEAQIETSGSLLLGGRPEAAASAALIAERPLGYGAGTAPSLADVARAKAAMASINYDPDNGYVEKFMFGGRFELHSVLADLWIWFGLAGAALAILVLVVCGRAVIIQIAQRAAPALLVFLVAKLLWNVWFSPVESAAPLTALTLGLLLLGPASPEKPAPPHRASPSSRTPHPAAV